MQKEGGYCIFHLQYHAKGRRVLYFSSSISCKRKEGIVFFIFNIMQKEGGYCIFHLQYHAKGNLCSVAHKSTRRSAQTVNCETYCY